MKFILKAVAILIVFISFIVVAGGQKRGSANNDNMPYCWLELPSDTISGAGIHNQTHWAMMNGHLQRNYSYCYSENLYSSYWVAYPLCEAHLTTGRSESWGYDTKVDIDAQTDVRKGYGVYEPTENYPKNFYARGHQVPNADRNAVPEMQAQTYFSTNMTPQIQHGFNGGIWAKLEAAVRGEVPHGDTLYVVTGASFSENGKESPQKEIINRNDNKKLSVPRHYWKVILKVKRTSNSTPDKACTIGFWLPHKDLKGHSYEEFVTSVDSIESLTGIDFFVNLPENLEEECESNSSWSVFREF